MGLWLKTILEKEGRSKTRVAPQDKSRTKLLSRVEGVAFVINSEFFGVLIPSQLTNTFCLLDFG